MKMNTLSFRERRKGRTGSTGVGEVLSSTIDDASFGTRISAKVHNENLSLWRE